MKQGLQLFVYLSILAMTACSSMRNIDLWPYGKKAVEAPDYKPENSIAYTCAAGKKFFVRFLDKGESVWLILPEREFAMPSVSTDNSRYSNTATTLSLNGDDATLEVSPTSKYTACKKEQVIKK